MKSGLLQAVILMGIGDTTIAPFNALNHGGAVVNVEYEGTLLCFVVTYLRGCALLVMSSESLAA